MSVLIDSTLWVDYFRTKTPLKIKRQIIPFIDSADTALCQPVRFEILRAAFRTERPRIEATFATVPILTSPEDLWEKSTILGQKCADARINLPAMGLLIAQICLAHQAELITFDPHFTHLAKVCPLKVRLLVRGIEP